MAMRTQAERYGPSAALPRPACNASATGHGDDADPDNCLEARMNPYPTHTSIALFALRAGSGRGVELFRRQ
jgi:hypothetical protein